MDNQSDIIRRQFPDHDSMWWSINEAGTFICSQWHILITPRCPTLWVWRVLACFYCYIACSDYIPCPNSSTGWCHSDYISTCTTSTMVIPHSNNATTHQPANENSAKALQRRPEQEDWQCTTAFTRRHYVHIHHPPMVPLLHSRWRMICTVN